MHVGICQKFKKYMYFGIFQMSLFFILSNCLKEKRNDWLFPTAWNKLWKGYAYEGMEVVLPLSRGCSANPTGTAGIEKVRDRTWAQRAQSQEERRNCVRTATSQFAFTSFIYRCCDNVPSPWQATPRTRFNFRGRGSSQIASKNMQNSVIRVLWKKPLELQIMYLYNEVM